MPTVWKSFVDSGSWTLALTIIYSTNFSLNWEIQIAINPFLHIQLIVKVYRDFFITFTSVVMSKYSGFRIWVTSKNVKQLKIKQNQNPLFHPCQPVLFPNSVFQMWAISILKSRIVLWYCM